MRKLIYLSSLVIITSLICYNLFNQGNQVKEINLYSARKENMFNELFLKFYKETGIRVNLITDKSPKLLARLKTEGKNSPADLLLTSDIITLENAKKSGLTLATNLPNISQTIEKNYQDPQGHWYGVSMRARAIFYNKKLVNKSQITNYQDLANKKFKNSILIRSSNNVYNQSLIAQMIINHGEAETKKWVSGIVSNFARKPFGGDTDQLRSLAMGKGKIAIANSYYFARLENSRNEYDRKLAKNIGIIFPDQESSGTNINLSGIALLKHSKNKENAKKLIKFLVTPATQQYIVNHNYEFPVIKNIKLKDSYQSWNGFKADNAALKKIHKFDLQALKIANHYGWH
jgi:iron(III) transport system substrate-binding protein